MSDVWKQLRAWFRSFTATEQYLSAVQVVLFIGLIAFLSFLILHFIACWRGNNSFPHNVDIDYTTVTIDDSDSKLSTSDHKSNSPTKHTSTTSEVTDSSPSRETSTLTTNVECTWKASQKTSVATHYYYKQEKTTEENSVIENVSPETQEGSVIVADDGDVDVGNKSHFVIALVKIKLNGDITFGCILTVITAHWAITAASCIESIEEVDSLDSFVMMERFGRKEQGKVLTVSDVMIHPLYQGTNKSYDLATLKSEAVLTINIASIPKLSTMFEYLLINLGESLDIYGFGKYRSNDSRPESRRLKRSRVSVMPLQRCEGSRSDEGGAAGDERWSVRHLAHGSGLLRVAGGVRGVCAARRGRGGSHACSWCAGAPLLRGGALLAIMAGNARCGLDCAPALYVPLAPLGDWILSVTNDKPVF
ncbi:unnamed protein product [Leptidea sinapis]|uniref:Peptidase S1 domain-containing protein n=1 Tax=Leptidea sinapis TaxID=189913 RepID=A0A5E4PPM3_9NEOP|nr:unnamed protein product [Leptidea sinapis]